MTKQRKIVDAIADDTGKTTHVLLDGNTNFLPVDRVLPMAERREIKGAHVVHPSDGRDDHLRTNPNKSVKDNIDTMCEDD